MNSQDRSLSWPLLLGALLTGLAFVGCMGILGVVIVRSRPASALPVAAATEVPTEIPVSPKPSTDTPMPVTPTREVVPTPTPPPTDTPEPTLEPAVIPDGWKTYAHFSDRFTVAYPPGWQVEDEGKSSVTLDARQYSGMTLGIYEPRCGVDEGGDPEEIQRCVAVEIADDISYGDEFHLVGTGAWDDGAHQGYYVEAQVRDRVYDSWIYRVHVEAPIRNRVGIQFGAIYFRVGTKSITAEERETMRLITQTFRYYLQP